jgi:hypothetical protein
MATQKVTQGLIYQELQSINKVLTEHTKADNENFRELRQLFEGTTEAPGIKVRVDRLEQETIIKRRHFGYVWGALVAIAAALVKILLH